MSDELSSYIFQIKTRIREYVTDIRGKTVSATGHFQCPITYNHKHGDKNPSCHLDTAPDGTGVWYCHTCQTGGTIYDLLYYEENMAIDGPAFLEATHYLAQKLKVWIPPDVFSGADYTKYSQDSSILEMYRAVEDYLVEVGNPVAALCDPDFGRGYSEELAAKYSSIVPMGSVDHNELFAYMREKFGDAFEKSVLCKHTAPNTVFSKNTLTISYRDQRGNPIRFIGRYRNSYIKSVSESDSRISKYIQTVGLYGKVKEVPFLLNMAMDEIKKTRKVVITEGEFDSLALQVMGIKNAIAARGASITERFIDMLKHMKVNEVTLILDNDTAGILSVRKYYKSFYDNNMALFVVPIDKGGDPDSYIKQGMVIDLANRIDAIEYILKNHRDFADTTIPDTVRYNNCISFIVDNVIMQSYQHKYAEEILAPAFGFHAENIFNDIRASIMGLETRDVRVKRIHSDVTAVGESAISDRISTYEKAAEQLRNISAERGSSIINSTFETYRALKRSDIKLPKRMKTGRMELDDECTLLTSTVSVWAGWPSNGKTTTIRNIALDILGNNPEHNPIIVHLSLDDDSKNTMLNYMSMLTNTKASKLRELMNTKKWADNPLEYEYGEMLDEFFKEDIHIFNSTECPDVATAGTIINTIHSNYPGRTIFMVVDALNNFVDFNKDNQISAAEAVVRDLKRFAVRYDAHVAIVAHFKKHPGTQRRPMLADLKGTSFLEHEGQNIFLMYMDAHYNIDSRMKWVDNSEGTCIMKPVIEINVAKDKAHNAAVTIPYCFNTTNLRIFEPRPEEMDVFLSILEKTAS